MVIYNEAKEIKATGELSDVVTSINLFGIHHMSSQTEANRFQFRGALVRVSDVFAQCRCATTFEQHRPRISFHDHAQDSLQGDRIFFRTGSPYPVCSCCFTILLLSLW